MDNPEMRRDEEPNLNSYWLRTKRQKLNDGNENVTYSSTPETTMKRKCPFLLIPYEIIPNILQYLSHEDISNNVRLINHKFRLAAEEYLNKSFLNLGKYIKSSYLSIVDLYHSVDSYSRKTTLLCIMNSLDIIHFEYNLILATIWRYVYNKVYTTYSCCMFGGKILDKFYFLINKLLKCKYSRISETYAYKNQVMNLIRLCKIFCIEFDMLVVYFTPYKTDLNSCKLIDMLELAKFGKKKICYEKLTKHKYMAKYTYYLKNAWFFSFRITSSDNILVNHQQLMFQRIRKLVGTHTKYFYEDLHLERISAFKNHGHFTRTKEMIVSFYGYHSTTFVYYGVMNELAFIRTYSNSTGSNDVLDPTDENMGPPNSYLGITIEVIVNCPLRYAPRHVLLNKILKSTLQKGGKYEMTLNINFPGASYLNVNGLYTFIDQFDIKA